MSSVYQVQSIISEVRQSFRLSLPLIISNLVQSGSVFVGTAMVAHLGTESLAASGLVWSIFLTIVVFYAGILGSVSVLVAQAYGANDYKGIRLAVTQGFWLGLIISIPSMLLFFVAAPLLKWSGQDLHVVQLATYYLHTLSFCMIPLAFLITVEQFLIGLGRTRLVLWISIIQVPCEILANYMFIFGKFGVPAYGVAGLGYGFSIVALLAFFVIALFLHYSSATRVYRVFSSVFEVNMTVLHELIRIGWPIGSMLLSEVGLFLVAAFLMGNIGSSTLAAHQIILQYWGITMALYFGISQTATIRIGHAVGRNDKPAVKLAGNVNLWLAFFVMLFVAFYYVVFPKAVIAVDINVHEVQNARLIHLTAILLIWSAIYQLADSFRFVAIGALRSLKDTKIPMLVCAFTFWCIALPLGYFFGFIMHFGGAGIWMGLVMGTAVGATILVLRFQRLVKRVELSKLLI